jgi:hypothetical protein
LDLLKRIRESRRQNWGASRVQRSLRICCRVFASSLLLLICPILIRAQSTVSEYQVKAAFLLNFAKFIEWPADAFSGEKTPLTLCIFRYDPFGGTLDEMIHGKTINNRELAARRVNEPEDLKGCQVVFVSDREDKVLSEIQKNLKDNSVLVVGESAEFAERGGSVQFFLEGDKLRFAVNIDAVQRARLQVSSKLLALARIVHDNGHPKRI